jgi:hypothetical protein
VCIFGAMWTFRFRVPFMTSFLPSISPNQHRWVPNCGWTTFRIRCDTDIEHAIWQMRLSYLRYAFKFEADPSRFFKTEAARLHLNPDQVTILSRLIPAWAAPKKHLSLPA